MSIASTLERLISGAESIRNTDPISLATMEVGDQHIQGDVRIIKLPDNFDAPMKRIEDFSGQVAPGTTQGSRHVISDPSVKAYTLDSATDLDGPVVFAESDFSLSHPSHGDCIEIPSGCYAFLGQRAFAKELRRSAD